MAASLPILLFAALVFISFAFLRTASALPPPKVDPIARHLRAIGQHLNPDLAPHKLDYARLFQPDLSPAQLNAVHQAARANGLFPPSPPTQLHTRDDHEEIARFSGVHGRHPTPKGFMSQASVSDLKEIAHFGAVAYCAEGANLQGWNCGRKCNNPTIQSSTLHSAINVEGSLAFIALRPSASQTVVTIRGTKTFENWVDNVFGIRRSPLPPFLANLTHHMQGATVHEGFVDSYRPLRAPIQTALRTLLQEPSSPVTQGLRNETSIVFTGHSLGGAVATLAALDLLASDIAVHPGRIRLVTFGMPRMGNGKFATLVDRALPNRVERVVEENDLVPHLPPMWSGYQHFAGERYITGGSSGNNKRVKVCEGQEDEQCSNSRVPWLSKDKHGGLLGLSGWFAKQTC